MSDTYPDGVGADRCTPLNMAQWIARLNFLGDHPEVREEHRAICRLLGHEPSGERLMVNPPIDICRWCAEYYRSKP